MKKLNKCLLLSTVYALSIYGTYTAITESYKLSVNFLKAKQIIQSPQDINEIVKTHAYLKNINPSVISTIIKYENRKTKSKKDRSWRDVDINTIKTDNVSKVGAIGLMQVMPINAKFCGYQVKELFDPNKNIDCGVKILINNLERQNDLTTAIAEYNGGKNGKNKSIETLDYKQEVLLALVNDITKF